MSLNDFLVNRCSPGLPRRQSKRSVLFLAGWLFFAIFTSANAQLVWNETVHEAVVKEGDLETRAVYSFENKGDYRVSILKVRTCCSCTAAELEKMHYQPGETGEVSVVFKFGKRRGRQEKSITVETNDAAHPQKVLLLRADLPKVDVGTEKSETRVIRRKS